MKSNVIQIHQDPIIEEYKSSIDKDSIIKTLAFKYFNNDKSLLANYLNAEADIVVAHDHINTKNFLKAKQLELSF